tara:strand:+ start:928 stop:1686 length:759 start_codon:yes stop_codon:yes gene_type:complete
MLPKKIKPEKLFKLIRIGKNNDGGYLICKNSLMKTKTLFSFGISDDFSFEKDFSTLSNCKVYAFDPTSTNIFFIKNIIKTILKFQFILSIKKIINFCKFIFFFKNKNNILIKKKIGKGGSLKSGSISLNDVLNTTNQKLDIFLKIDIEGSEYRILEEIILNSKIINGIAIEFHDADINIDKIVNFVDRLELKLVHIHPNNFAEQGANNIPSSLELTFSKSPEIVDDDLIFPHKLDQRNDPISNDIELIFEDH